MAFEGVGEAGTAQITEAHWRVITGGWWGGGAGRQVRVCVVVAAARGSDMR